MTKTKYEVWRSSYVSTHYVTTTRNIEDMLNSILEMYPDCRKVFLIVEGEKQVIHGAYRPRKNKITQDQVSCLS